MCYQPRKARHPRVLLQVGGMTETTAPETQHFTKAVAQLGESRPVVASRAIFNAQGVKIVEKGVAINLGLYDRLMQHQLSAPMEDAVAATSTVTGKSLREIAEETMRDVPFFARMAPDAKTRGVLLDAIEKLPLPDAMAFQLTLAYEVRPEIYLHSVRSALTCAWLALVPMGSRFDVGMAAAAGLLHDVGMLHVDPLLLQPEHDLSEEQRRQLYSHPILATTLIERHHVYPKEVVRAVAEHHENLDGSGYPRSLTEGSISDLGSALSLAEVVTAMFTPGRQAPELRLSVILRMNQKRYAPGLVKRVLELVQPLQDASGAVMSLLSDPVGRLREIDRVIGEWPAEALAGQTQTRQRQDALTSLTAQAAQLHRNLASVGAAPGQLDQLGTEALDDLLQQELSLLAVEATWQLRALERQCRRLWRLAADEAFPTPLQLWLDQVGAQVTQSDPVQDTPVEGVLTPAMASTAE